MARKFKKFTPLMQYVFRINGECFTAIFFQYSLRGCRFAYFKFFESQPVIGAFRRKEVPLEWLLNGFVESEVKQLDIANEEL